MGCFVVENAFGIIKKTFQELLTRSYSPMSFLPYVFTFCLLHNLFRFPTKSNIQKLMRIIEAGDVQVIQETNTTHRFDVYIEY
jgi:hypothetical protein